MLVNHGDCCRHGLPVAVSSHAANHREVTLLKLNFDFRMIEANPENLIGNKASDSDQFDEEMQKDVTNFIAPHKSNRVKP